MHITLLTTGSRGDVQPFLALALGLKNAGYSVLLAAPPEFKLLIESFNIDFSPLGKKRENQFASKMNNLNVEDGATLRFFLYRLKAKMQLFYSMNIEALRICQNTDAIINRISVFLDAYSIAQKFKIPYIEVGLDPQSPTKEFPHMDLSHIPEFGGVFNKLSYSFHENITWHIFRHSIQTFRRNNLGLDPFPLTGPGIVKRKQKIPILYAFSPYVVPKPKDWPGNAHITGYWFINSQGKFLLPESIRNFIDSGNQPVYVGFGSMTNRQSFELIKIIVEALEICNRRGVIATVSDHQELNKIYSSEKYLFLNEIPHDLLFPYMAAVVHHGGVGTTAASLRAGIPCVIVPHNYDQPFWGKTVARLGASPNPIPRNKLTAKRLAENIQIATDNQTVQKKARAIAEKIQLENGVSCAVDLINQYIR